MDFPVPFGPHTTFNLFVNVNGVDDKLVFVVVFVSVTFLIISHQFKSYHALGTVLTLDQENTPHQHMSKNCAIGHDESNRVCTSFASLLT